MGFVITVCRFAGAAGTRGEHEGVDDDAPSGAASLSAQLARKYIWWDRDSLPNVPRRRIVAQVMNLGTYEDVQALVSAVRENPLVDANRASRTGFV